MNELLRRKEERERTEADAKSDTNVATIVVTYNVAVPS